MSSDRNSNYLAITEEVRSVPEDPEQVRSVNKFNENGSIYGEIVPFYGNVDNVSHVENSKTEKCENQKAPISCRFILVSITSRLHRDSRTEERRLCEMVNYKGKLLLEKLEL